MLFPVIKAIFLAAFKDGKMFPFAYSERVDAFKPAANNAWRLSFTSFLKNVILFMIPFYTTKNNMSSGISVPSENNSFFYEIVVDFCFLELYKAININKIKQQGGKTWKSKLNTVEKKLAR